MRPARIDVALLAGVGALAVHEIAYLPAALGASVGAADTAAGIAHARGPALWAIAGLLALVAVGRAIVVSVRSRPGAGPPDGRVLGAVIAGVYVTQEIAERCVAGRSPSSLLGEPALWLGLVAAPLVAAVLCRLVRTVAAVAASTPVRSRPPRERRPVVLHSIIGGGSTVVALHSLSRRGPPCADRCAT